MRLNLIGTPPWVQCTWEEIRDISNSRGLGLQCDESQDLDSEDFADYHFTNIWVIDQGIVYTTKLYVNEVVESMVPWSQEQNDIWRAEFDGYYFANCNQEMKKFPEISFGAEKVINFNDAVSYGLISGAYGGKIIGSINTLALTTVVVRDTTYNVPSTAAQRSFKSASASDTSAGTGARSVKITYFDDSMNGPFTETVILNGTTAVATVATNIQFIEKMEVMSAGSGSTNAGIISLYTNNNGTGTVIGSIGTGDSVTLWAHHYVASGKTCYINYMKVAGTATAGSSFLRAIGNPITGTGVSVIKTSNLVHTGGGTSEFNWKTPVVVEGPNLVVAYETPSSITASSTHVSFDFIEM